LNLSIIGLPLSLDCRITEKSPPTNTTDYDYSNFLTSMTFQTYTLPNGKKIEPPSPQLIALHAVCVKIAHMSGAAEHLEETFRDTEPLPVMTAPNAANEPVHALKKIQLQYITRLMYV